MGREGYFSPRPFAPVFDYGYESVMHSHAESLERLKAARIDILLCHDIGRVTHGAAHAARVAEFLDGGYRAMRELRDAGTVRAIGLGVNEWEICVELLESCDFDCILLAGRYTLLEQPALATLLPICEQRRVSIICGGPFNSGILAAGSRAGARRTTTTRRHRLRSSSACAGWNSCARISRCRCKPRRCSSRSGIRASPASSPDARTAPKSRNCAAMFSHPVPREFWRALRERGLVDARAPLPA